MLKPSNKLKNAILQLAPLHRAIESAPDNFKALKESFKGKTFDVDVLEVYSGGGRSIYGQKVNYAFRAWHDKIHLKYNLGFSLKDELKTVKQHFRELKAFNVSRKDRAIFYIDAALQVKFYYLRK